MLTSISRLTDYVGCAWTLGKTPLGKWDIFWRQTKNLRTRLKFATLHPSTIFSLGTIYGPLFFRDNFGDITNLANLIYRETYRVKTLPQEGIIIDAGANIGLAAHWFAWHNPEKKIYCFEPLTQNISLIKKNCPSAILTQTLLGSEKGQVKLQVDPDQVMASSVPCSWETKPEEFPVQTLDDLGKTFAWDRVALLKIDVEGMEIEVLKGARETLAHVHQVVMETHGKDRHQESIRRLTQAGLDITSEEYDGHTGMIYAIRSVEKQTSLRVSTP
jgi:FkbM family methyltransferase